MKIRPFAEADLAEVYSLQCRSPELAQWREQDYLGLARDPRGTLLVAEAGEGNSRKLAGFAVFHRVLDEAELRNIAVDAALRGKGIGRALLAAGIHILEQLGVRRVFLEVRPSNQRALRFYAAAGFKRLSTRPGYYHDPVEDAHVMACDIGRFTEKR